MNIKFDNFVCHLQELLHTVAHTMTRCRAPEAPLRDRALKRRAKDSGRSFESGPNPSTLLRPKSYLTHDNGGRAFLVKFDKSRFEVFAPDIRRLNSLTGNETKKTLEKCFTRCVLRAFHVRVMIGKSTKSWADGTGPKFDGNSILFELVDGRYICVGERIILFAPGERILRYESPVGISDVPFPYAVGSNRYYLTMLGGCVWVDRKEMSRAKIGGKTVRNPYDFAFQRHVAYRSGNVPRLKVEAYAKYHRLPGLKVLHKRTLYAE